MPKTIILSRHPYHLAQVPNASFTPITPNFQAAQTLGVKHLSLENLALNTLSHKGLLCASPIPAQRALREAVREVLGVKDVAGTARAVFPSIQEILRSGAVGTEAAPSERSERLLRVAAAYRERLEQQHLLDRAEALWRASEEVREQQKLFVWGYPRVGVGELKFLNQIAAEGSIFVLPYADAPLFGENLQAARWLEERAWRIERAQDEAQTFGERAATCFYSSATPIDVQARVYPHQEAEVRAVLTEVKQLLQAGVSEGDIVLVARDERDYGRLVTSVAWEYGLPVRTFYGVSLKDTRVGSWLRLLQEVLQGRAPFEPTVRLLAHPLSRRLEPETWAAVRREHPAGLEAWAAAGVEVASLAWPETASRQAYSERLEETLAHFALRERAEDYTQEKLAFHALLRVVANLAHPPAEGVTLETFWGEAADFLDLHNVHTRNERQGVALHTPLSLYGSSYRHVFVMGLAEGVLPAPIADDPTLDFHERKRLRERGIRLETAAEAANREDLSFWALLQTPLESLTLSYPRLMADGARLESPYFSALGLKPAPPPAKAAASLEERRQRVLQRVVADEDGVLEQARAHHAVELRRESDAAFDEYDGITGIGVSYIERTFSATQFSSLGACGFKYFAQYLLKLEEPDEAEEDISAMLRGRLYHKTLELALKPALGQPNPREVALEHLERAFKEAERLENIPPLPNWHLRRLEYLQGLRQVLQAESFLPPESDVVMLERKFEAGWRGFRVRGYVDRVDRRPEGLVLLDYKTSSSKPMGAQDEAGKATLDIQLPLYVEAAAPALLPDEVVSNAVYYSLTKAKEIGKAKIDTAALDSFAERVRQSLSTGSFPVLPDVAYSACTYCDYDALCRRGARIERKRQEATHESDA